MRGRWCAPAASRYPLGVGEGTPDHAATRVKLAEHTRILAACLRLMWASDYTQIRPRFHWGQVLYYVLDWHSLSDDEAQ
jgi:hypothetical protein